jgi:hypothetical protein
LTIGSEYSASQRIVVGLAKLTSGGLVMRDITGIQSGPPGE